MDSQIKSVDIRNVTTTEGTNIQIYARIVLKLPKYITTLHLPSKATHTHISISHLFACFVIIFIFRLFPDFGLTKKGHKIS